MKSHCWMGEWALKRQEDLKKIFEWIQIQQTTFNEIYDFFYTFGIGHWTLDVRHSKMIYSIALNDFWISRLTTPLLRPTMTNWIKMVLIPVNKKKTIFNNTHCCAFSWITHISSHISMSQAVGIIIHFVGAKIANVCFVWLYFYMWFASTLLVKSKKK